MKKISILLLIFCSVSSMDYKRKLEYYNKLHPEQVKLALSLLNAQIFELQTAPEGLGKWMFRVEQERSRQIEFLERAMEILKQKNCY